MLELLHSNDNDDINKLEKQLESYTVLLKGVAERQVYEADESSINLPSDEGLLVRVNQLVSEKVTDRLRYHIVIGIGGSNLGTKAVYDALYGFADIMQPNRYPKMLFAETTDSEWLGVLCGLLETIQNPYEVLISVISKSGGTSETLANLEIILNRIET